MKNHFREKNYITFENRTQTIKSIIKFVKNEEERQLIRLNNFLKESIENYGKK